MENHWIRCGKTFWLYCIFDSTLDLVYSSWSHLAACSLLAASLESLTRRILLTKLVSYQINRSVMKNLCLSQATRILVRISVHVRSRQPALRHRLTFCLWSTLLILGCFFLPCQFFTSLKVAFPSVIARNWSTASIMQHFVAKIAVLW